MDKYFQYIKLIITCLVIILFFTGCDFWFGLFIDEPDSEKGDPLEVTVVLSVPGMIVDTARPIWILLNHSPEEQPVVWKPIEVNGGTVGFQSPPDAVCVIAAYDPTGEYEPGNGDNQDTSGVFYLEFWENLTLEEVMTGCEIPLLSFSDGNKERLHLDLEVRNLFNMDLIAYTPPPPPAADYAIEVYAAYNVPAEGDSILELYGFNGEYYLIAENDDWEFPNSQYSKIEYNLDMGIAYYIRVAGYDIWQQFGYAVCVYETSSGRPEAESNDGDGTEWDSREEMNNYPEGAETLYLNNPAYRNIHQGDSEDWFALNFDPTPPPTTPPF